MTLKFNNAYIKNSYIFLGRNEHNISVKADKKVKDYYLNCKSIEQAESLMYESSIKGLLKKTKLKESDIDVVIGGDLQSQLLSSTLALRNFDLPFIGHYSACSTFTGSLILASSLLKFNEINNIIVSTSSHNLVAEKQFRFPIEYGSIKKKVNTFTATGAVSSLITKEKTNIKIESATIGKVVDLGYTDTNNMGACMATSAALTIHEHLKETKRRSDYYDVILTGDLGIYGVNILKDYIKEEFNIKLDNVVDAGSILFKPETDEIAGGSGPICLPLILFDKILKSGYKKILLVATGALHSKTSCNLDESVSSISHAVSLEVTK